MSIGTPLQARTTPLNRKAQWREWSGYFAASVYDHAAIHEYFAIRNSAALIDVSPLYKYRLHGPDAVRLINRVITRDASKVAPGQVIYTPWCDEAGKVIDDGTVARLEDDSFRWTSAEPHLRWFELNARGLDVELEDTSEQLAAIALQGPLARDVLAAATDIDWADLPYYRRRAATLGRVPVDVSRTGYTGDLGYEIWVEAAAATSAWDRLVEAGRQHGIHAAGMLALDMARIEAGLILIEVDYTPARQAMSRAQMYSPFELGLGRLVNLDKTTEFVGKRALAEEQRRGGPARRLVGLAIDWTDVERLFGAQDLPVAVGGVAWREQIPVFAGSRQVGRATSGTWSPLLKQHIALASVERGFEGQGTRLAIEWTVEGERGRASAVVSPLPFFDPPRKRA